MFNLSTREIVKVDPLMLDTGVVQICDQILCVWTVMMYRIMMMTTIAMHHEQRRDGWMVGSNGSSNDDDDGDNK